MSSRVQGVSAQPQPPAEAELLERARAGDRDAFEHLAVLAMPRLLGTARRFLNSAMAADEAVAEALFRAYRRVERFEGRSAFSTWMHRILCRVVADRYRENARDRERRKQLEAAARGAPRSTRAAQPLDQLTADETSERLRAAAGLLPPTQKLVLLLFAWEGLSLDEIAGALGLKYPPVKSHLDHARKALRKRLEDEEEVS